MRNTKKIWRDNTMPPTNYIWMRVNMRNELLGVYEWLNGNWYRINIHSGDSCDSYSKTEVDLLLEYTEQEIINKIINGEYDIGNITVDSELSFESTNPVENRVITAELAKKLDKVEFNASDTFITAEDVSEIDSVVRDTYTKQEIDETLNTKQNLIVISSLEPTPSDGKDGDIWIVI